MHEQSDLTAANKQEIREPEQLTSPEVKSRQGTAWVTYVIIAVCGGLWAYFKLGNELARYVDVVDFLAPRNFIIWTGAWWGLATSAFVHFEIWHIFFNMWWTKDLGGLLEPTMGKGKFIFFVLAAAIVSSGVQLAFSSQTGIGFSGVVYAMFGYGIAVRRIQPTYSKILNSKTIIWLLGWLILCILLSYAGILNIANAAHFGGLAFGYCFGMGFVVRNRVIPCRIALAILGVLTILSVTWMPWSESWQQRSAIHYVESLIKAGDREEQYEVGRALIDFYDDAVGAIQFLSLSAEQGYVPAMNRLAWILSTNPDAAIRNGDQAVTWALQACEADNWASSVYIDTLAAAYAEVDMWDDAITTQRLALRIVREENTWQLETPYTSRLQRYINREKAREQ
ncbi:rhomboid family intramembrane serine protease [Candidatus Bipolaricaulota bacterium]|nr:rhomboid family intramembrane serine protease [Candidatus Bipolaricaulota bacterium]